MGVEVGYEGIGFRIFFEVYVVSECCDIGYNMWVMRMLFQIVGVYYCF